MIDRARYLGAVIRWKMTELQADAYGMCLEFEDAVRKIFPAYRLGIRKKGDPRQSELFRHAMKAVVDHAGELKPKDYPHYVHAQLTISKEAAAKEGREPLIGPGILSGPKAWARWQVWLKKNSSLAHAGDAVISERKRQSPHEIKAAFSASRRHMLAMMKGVDRGKIMAAMTTGKLPRWVALGQVDPRVPLLSAAVRDWLAGKKKGLEEIFGAKVESYRGDLSAELFGLYREVFPEDA